MTSTSFNSPKPGPLELLRNTQQASLAMPEECAASQSLPFESTEYEAEARRMKAYAGERKFQAPVSDDFSRGLLAELQTPGAGGDSLKDTGLINTWQAGGVGESWMRVVDHGFTYCHWY